MNTPSFSRRVVYGSAALLVAVCASVLMSEAAWAHGYAYGRSGYGHYAYGPRVGIVIGAPYWGYYPYPPPYYYPYSPPYYPPPVVVAPPSPPVYVEKGQPPSASQATPQAPPAAVWYYCSGENGYYPYVRQCPGGWQTVPAQPPPPPPPH